MTKFSLVEYLFSRSWPLQLFALIGIVIAGVRWQRHPKVSLLTVSGLLLLLLQSLVFGTIYYLLPRLLDQGYSYGSLNNLYLFIEIVRDFVHAGVIVLLVSAAFGQRGPRDIPVTT